MSTHHREDPSSTPAKPLLTVRAALVLLLAIVVGVLAGVLAGLGGNTIPAAVLVGGCATGGALLLFHSIFDN